MTSTTLFRVIAGLFVVFAIGHTLGFLRFVPPTPESVAVRDAMNGVTFGPTAPRLSYGGFYRGFGLYITVYLVFSAFLAWYLGDAVRTTPAAVAPLAWGLVVVQVVGLALSWIYFSAPPAVFSAVIAVLLALAAWRIPNVTVAARGGL